MKVAIIGAAGANAKNHIAAWKKNDIPIKFVVDLNEEKGREVAGNIGAEFLSDYKELDAGKIDAVSVNLPPFLHAGVCKYFLEKDIHVLCEKPVTLNRSEGELLADTLKKSKAFLMAGFCLRFNTLYQKMRELVQNGEIGETVMLNSRYSTLNAGASGWRSDPAKGGGICLVNRIHSIDLAYWMLGQKITSVDAYGNSMFFNGKAEDNCILLLQHEKGCVSKIYGHYWRINKSVVEFEIIGTTGRISIENNNSLVLEKENGTSEVLTVPAANMYENEVRHFISCINEKRIPSCGLEDSMRATDIVDDAISSIKKGKRICRTN